jgi:hypothetical protein
MDCFAEPVIGRAFRATRWLATTLAITLVQSLIQFSNSLIVIASERVRAKRGQMTGSAKQSIGDRIERVDCFVAFAPRNDEIHASAFPRRDDARVARNHPRKTEGAGNAGRAVRTHSLACEIEKARKHSHHRYTASTGTPCAMVLTAYFVLSPVTGLFCHRRSRIAPRP